MALRTLSVTMQAGKAVSDSLDCSGTLRILRIIMPSAWTTAPLSFCMSVDNVTYHDLYFTSAASLDAYEVTVPIVIPDSIVAFPPNTGFSVGWFKIRSGNHTTPVVQPAARTFQIVAEVADAPVVVTGPTGAAGAVGPTGAVGPPLASQAATGPTGGYVQSGNIITQWGSFVASTAGVTVNFPRPYVDGPPSVTASAAAGGTLQVSATKTSITISCNAGNPTVSWKAIGS